MGSHSPHPVRLFAPDKLARLSTLFVVMAALCWGLSGGIGAILMSADWNAFVVAFYRGAIGLLFVLAWLLLRPAGSGLTNPFLWFWSALAGVGVAGNFSFYFISIAEGSVAVAATLMYCASVFVYLVSFALRLETATPLKWAAIALVMLGVVLLTGIYDIGASAVTPLGVGAGLLAGLCYALFIFGFKYAAPHGSPQAILLIAFMVPVAILAWAGDIAQILAVLHAPAWPLFVLLGILGAGLSFVLYIVGLNYTAPAVASVVAMVEPVTASLFGVLVLSEDLTDIQFFGMGLILLTVTALSIYSSVHRAFYDGAGY
jgi:drug/metabolite transporter (DMT)-like permease